MTDLDVLMAGAMVTCLTLAGAYVAMRRRANETPVGAYDSPREGIPVPPSSTSESAQTR